MVRRPRSCCLGVAVAVLDAVGLRGFEVADHGGGGDGVVVELVVLDVDGHPVVVVRAVVLLGLLARRFAVRVPLVDERERAEDHLVGDALEVGEAREVVEQADDGALEVVGVDAEVDAVRLAVEDVDAADELEGLGIRRRGVPELDAGVGRVVVEEVVGLLHLRVGADAEEVGRAVEQDRVPRCHLAVAEVRAALVEVEARGVEAVERVVLEVDARVVRAAADRVDLDGQVERVRRGVRGREDDGARRGVRVAELERDELEEAAPRDI
mmetsp:Transcript_24566/g.97478  ORF Transcript_24566/g.97478 Transcript_24566/m.97478 type:complete len:268 (+) Transcript_24566:2215-3018(+)